MNRLRECPTCGGELIVAQREELLRGGVNMATVTVTADICHRCGQRLYDPDTIRRFEKIRKKLSNQDVDEFEPLGQSFRVAG